MPTAYRFVLEGAVDAALLAGLGQLTVSKDGADTILSGVGEQSELQAVLRRILEHDLTLLGLIANPV